MFMSSFNDAATLETYTLSLHDALPILKTNTPLRSQVTSWWATRWVSMRSVRNSDLKAAMIPRPAITIPTITQRWPRSEEHTSELQSRLHLVCRLLLENKNTPTHRSVDS